MPAKRVTVFKRPAGSPPQQASPSPTNDDNKTITLVPTPATCSLPDPASPACLPAAANSNGNDDGDSSILATREPDTSCDLCQFRVSRECELADHVKDMHAAMHFWVERVAAMPRPAAPSALLAEQIGQMAVALAVKKDGGPTAWEAMRRIWQQLRQVIAHRDLQLRVFGSCIAMGSWDGKGDVDLSYVQPFECGSTDAANYPLQSVKDEAKEVLRVARLLRDAGFAFDDLEPVVRTRVPIVKHKHRAPPVEDNGWKRIDSNPNSRKIRLSFHGTAHEVMDEIFHETDKDTKCEWVGRGTMVVTAKSTTDACQIYRNPWGFVSQCFARALAKSREERAKVQQRQQQQNDIKSTAAAMKNNNNNDDDDCNNNTSSNNSAAAAEVRVDVTGMSPKQLKQYFVDTFRALEPTVIVSVMEHCNFDAEKSNAALERMNAEAVAAQAAAATPAQASASSNIAAPGARAAAADDQRKLIAAYPIEGFTRGQFERWLQKTDWYSTEYYSFPEMFHADFDLSFRSPGFRNSVLLRAYFLQSPLARIGAAFVKQWSKDSAVNAAIKGYWTTYCINIVWIAFLIHRGVVQFVPPTSIPVYVSNEEFEQKILQYVPMRDGTQGLSEQQLARQVGELLFEFYRFCAYDFDWENKVITLRQAEPFGRGNVSTAGKPWTHANEVRIGKFRDRRWYRMCVDDPYEADLSLGRHLSPAKAGRVLAQFKYMAQRLAAQQHVAVAPAKALAASQNDADDDGEGQSNTKKKKTDVLVAAVSVPVPKSSSAWGAPPQAAAAATDAKQSNSSDDDEAAAAQIEDPTSGMRRDEQHQCWIAVPLTGPLLIDVQPDNLTPNALSRELFQLLIGAHHLPVEQWLAMLSSAALYKLAACNTFYSLDEILATVCVDAFKVPTLALARNGKNDDIDDVSSRKAAETSNMTLRVVHRNPDHTFVPAEAKEPLRRLAARVQRKGFVEVDKKMAGASGKLQLQGLYIRVLQRLFEFTSTDFGAAGSVVLFRGESDKEAYLAAKRHAAGGASASSAAASAAAAVSAGGSGAGGGVMPEKKDPNRSQVGTCDQCGDRKRRIYGSTDKKSSARYCDACWEAYEKQFAKK